MAAVIGPIHPGEILLQEFLLPLGMSAPELARAMGVTPSDINEVVISRKGLSGDLALRLAAYFDTTPEFWMNLQSHYELETACDRLDAEIDSLPRRQQTR